MMIRPRLRFISRNQRGFSLAELLVAIAITALIGSATASAVYQVVRINSSSTNRQIAITQVENAVHYISRDTQQAQQVIPKNSIGVVISNFNLVTLDTLTLKWIGWDNNKNEITYTVVSGTLKKATTINDDFANTVTMNIASNITAASGSWNTTTKILDNFQIQVTVGASHPAIEKRTFQIIPRPAQ